MNFIRNMFKKKESVEVINRRAEIVSEIIDLARERRELKYKLEELRDDVLVDIKREIDSVVKEIDVVNKALFINDRKIQDSTIFLEEEMNVEDNGMYV